MNEASNNNNNNKILSVCKGFAISKGMSIKKHRKTMKTEWIKKNAQIGRRNEWTTAQHDSNVKQWRRWNRKRMEGTSWVQLFGAMLFLPNKMERKWTTWNEHLAKPKWKQQFQMATERERVRVRGALAWYGQNWNALPAVECFVCLYLYAQAKDSGDHI